MNARDALEVMLRAPWANGEDVGCGCERCEEKRQALATLTALVERAGEPVWRPIETAPKERTPMIVVRGKLESGYVTDPWCVWWQEGKWQRWPHKEMPTEWLPLPPAADEAKP